VYDNGHAVGILRRASSNPTMKNFSIYLLGNDVRYLEPCSCYNFASAAVANWFFVWGYSILNPHRIKFINVAQCKRTTIVLKWNRLYRIGESRRLSLNSIQYKLAQVKVDLEKNRSMALIIH